MIAPRSFTEGQIVRDRGNRDLGPAKITKPSKWTSDVTYPDGRKVTLVNTRIEIAQSEVTS